MLRLHTMLIRLLLLHATAAAFPMLGAEIPLGERTKMSWDAPPNGDDGVDHFQLFLPRRWSKGSKLADAHFPARRGRRRVVQRLNACGRGDEQPVAAAVMQPASAAGPVDGVRSEEELGV